MAEKQVLHIISHSHWDREWYMPFEKHRARLIDLMDDILDTLDKNPNFKYFHLDGQVIPVEDYLEIRPEMKDKLIGYIKKGRIFIGPWYVLQDEYLISSESNVRNMLLGIRECRRYGSPLMIGYFPDSFGNISQAPQILRGFDIDCCAFGRGVRPVGFDNQVIEQEDDGVYHSTEYHWQSPDGSDVIGVLFANWYHNAMEIPSEHDEAVERIKKIIANTARFAYTPHLLGMNGCDHEPLQCDIGDIIKSVKKDFPECEIRHSNFLDYMNSIRPYADRFPIVKGELCGQDTNGYFNLTNTASARIYMKQANHKNQQTLEKQAEPLSVLAFANGGEYRKELINYAWKKMLENHAHDSICGCSVDAVHRECMSRFEKSTAMAESVRDSAFDYIAENVTTEQNCKQAIIIYNPNGFKHTATVTATIDLPTDDETPIENIGIFDADGKQIAADIVDGGKIIDYTLPRHTFRKVFYFRRLTATFTATDISPVGYTVYTVKNTKKQAASALSVEAYTAENKFISVTVNPDGTFNLTDKKSGYTATNLGYFEESGDGGDEYNFAKPKHDKVYTTLGKKAVITADVHKTYVEFTVKTKLSVPLNSSGEWRSREKTTIEFVNHLKIGEKSKGVEIFTEIENTARRHRIRAMFPNDIKTDTVYVDGQYDLLARPIKTGKNWTNPDNTQRVQSFFMLGDKSHSMLVANKGLLEYEVLRDGSNTMAVTLLRCPTELGDWAYFPTPEASCIGHNVAHYMVTVGGKKTENMRKEGYAFSTGDMLTHKAPAGQNGKLPSEYSFVSLNADNCVLSAVKKAEEDNGIIVRFYNPTEKGETAVLKFGSKVKKAELVNLNEDVKGTLKVADNSLEITPSAKKIITVKVTF